MQVRKEYKKGGFFGSSQDRFADMEGAGSGINMAFGSRGILGGNLGGKGRALRREKRYLKKLDRQGKLNEYGPRSMDRLKYLKKVQKDRAKKIAGAGALAAGAAFAGPAALSAIKTGALKGGATQAAGKGGLKAFLGKAQKGKKALDLIRRMLGKGDESLTPEQEALTPEQMQEIEEGNFGQIDQFMEQGGRIMMGGGMMQFNPAEREMLMAMLGAKLPR